MRVAATALATIASLRPLLDDLGVEYVEAEDGSFVAVATEHNGAIVCELLELEFGACVLLSLPLLRAVHEPPSSAALAAAMQEQAQMVFTKIIHDGAARIVELRHELLLDGLDAGRLSVAMSALAASSTSQERLELLFGGIRGPNIEDIAGDA